MVERFNGVLSKYYKRDESTGVSIIGIETDEIDVKRNSDGLVVVDSVIPKWPLDTCLMLTGTWNDNRYESKTIKPYTETREMSKKILKRIITELKEESDEFKMSTCTINKIIDVAGDDILSFSRDPKALEIMIENLPKIDTTKLELVYNRLMSISSSYVILEYISGFGGTIANCDKLMKMYGKNALKRLKRDPYGIGYRAGLDFFTCDRIGKSLNFDALHLNRIKSMIYEGLDIITTQSGSTYSTQFALKKQIAKLVKKSSYPSEPVPAAVLAAAIQTMSGIVMEKANNGIRVYRKKIWDCEVFIAKNLLRLNERKEDSFYNEKIIEDVEKHLKIKYSEKQKESFEVLRTNGIKIITGGPGTGKTTIVNGIIYMYQTMHPCNNILLCAPTGRAAQRMSEITQMDAETIHRTLKFRPFSDGEMKHKDASDPLLADLIILDEMSMVDTEIFALLLPAIKAGATLILIGDEDQLQSVSSGNVLHDLIESNKFETHRLKEIFRQKGLPTIIDNAYKVLDGRMDFVKDSSFHITACETIKEAMERLEELFDTFRENGKEHNIQILSPVKVGDGGTRAINTIISQKVNKENGEKSFTYGRTSYHKNDKVIFLNNNYEKDYYNGDIGYITEILRNGFMVKVGSEEKRVTGNCLKEVTLAYGITIHKAQGSEAEIVVIVLPDTYQNMLNRNMLFTAITRAKKQVEIIYVNSALSDSVHTTRIDQRKTGLTKKIQGKKGEVVNCH